jgi:hypothetical protein
MESKYPLLGELIATITKSHLLLLHQYKGTTIIIALMNEFWLDNICHMSDTCNLHPCSSEFVQKHMTSIEQ